MNPGRTIRALGLLLVLAATSMSALAQQQRVEVQLSANRVSVDESVILNVRAFAIDAAIDASALDKDFVVTQRSSSRQVTIENGKRTSLVEWVLELTPTRTGAVEVPPIIVGSEQSRPLTLLVEQPATGADRDMYLEASVDISNPFVQAQVIYTLRVFQDVRFLEATLQVPEVDGVVMQQLSEEKNYQETVNGRVYGVSEIRYAVFPQQSGDVVIPTLVLQAVIAVDQNQVPNTRTRTRRITRRANEVELTVRARPDGMAGSWWLPATAVTLQSEWSSPINAMTVGQPVTRTIHLLASGAGDSQLPELEVPSISDISIYADSPTAETSTSERGVVSQQTNTWAVIPQLAGQLVLPEMEVNWFDTTTGEARVAVLPAETLTVTNASTTAQPSKGVTPSSDTKPTVDQAEQSNSGDDTDALSEDAISDSSTNTDHFGQDSVGESAAMSNVVNTNALEAVDRWRNVAAALLAGWVLSLIGLWLWVRRRTSAGAGRATAMPVESESSSTRFQRRAGSRAALEAIKVACDTADASKISQAVLSWATMVWPGNAPTHISAVAERLKSTDLADAFDAIDAQQYRPAGSVKPMAADAIPGLLKDAVDQYREAEPAASAKNALPSL